MNPVIIFLAIAVYFGLLFLVAYIVEKESPLSIRLASSPMVYSLSLAVYCTSWTYYGSVGKAATSGLSFLGVYLGATMMICLWWMVLRRMVIIKDRYRITSIADFISARYMKSQSLAALVTLMALIGSMPYIALQFEAVKSTFILLIEADVGKETWLIDNFGPILVLVMTFFTIMFGARKLDPTERHRGMMTAIALESIVKLIAFSACGILACYYLFHGHSEGVLQSLLTNPATAKVLQLSDGGGGYLTWTTLIILSMSAILFLPRQFHVAVVENSAVRNILPAMWQFPLYMFLINIFVIPIALYGITSGIPISLADTYVLRIPVLHGNTWLALFVFLGGFSAAMSMIVIASMTMSTMLVNHLLLPLFNLLPPLSGMRRYLLGWRWISILFILAAGYWFQIELGKSYALVNMGLISFAAVLQFAPTAIGAVYWSAGSKRGALSGLSAGFFIWFYTLMLPAFIKSGLMSTSLLIDGPWGIAWLRPEHLFGLDALPALSHTVFWSLLFNIAAFVLVSLFFGQSEEERIIALDFRSIAQIKPVVAAEHSSDESIDINEKNEILLSVINEYFPPEKSKEILNQKLIDMKLQDRKGVSIIDFAEFHRSIEIILAGSIGAAMAHRAMNREYVFPRKEKARLSRAYADILSRLNVSPQELAQKINFYQEREHLLTAHGRELEQRIKEKEQEIETRIQIEKALKNAEQQYRSIFDNALEGIFQASDTGKILVVNPAMATILGYPTPAALIEAAPDIRDHLKAGSTEMGSPFHHLLEGKNLANFEVQAINAKGKTLWLNLNARPLFDAQGRLTLIEGSAEDVTQRKEAEERLSRYHEELEEAVKLRTAEVIENQAFLQKVLEGILAAIIVIDRETFEVLDCNSIAEKLLGYTKQALIENNNALLKTKVLQRDTDRHRTELVLERQNGELVPVRRNILFMVYKGIFAQALILFDISERKALERQANMAQKLQSIGQLAAGIAHEINTPMQFIGTNITFLEEANQGMAILTQSIREVLTTSPPEVAEKLLSALEEADWEYLMEEVPVAIEQSKDGVARVSSIVKAMKDFSHPSSREKESVVVNSIIETTVLVARNEWKYVSDVTTDLAADLPLVPCFVDEMGQVILNLLTNAAQAIGEKLGQNPSGEKGEIHISTKLIDSSVEIRVRDTGQGIPVPIRERIFDPFFTTKEVGRGTGQGLTISHDIITQKHGGTLTFETEDGVGTTFIIRLPLAS
ncbi:MAG: PAS domain S-box protein [Pseudomonadota bacterium]